MVCPLPEAEGRQAARQVTPTCGSTPKDELTILTSFGSYKAGQFVLITPMAADHKPLGERVFLSVDVTRLAGVSLRQLQWWDERKVISPHKDDHRRVYAPEQVLEILTVSALRRKGLSLQKIRKILRQLRRELVNEDKLMVANADTRVYLVTDGKSTWFDHDSGRVLTRLTGAKASMYVVSLTDQVNRISSAQAPHRYRAKQLPLFSGK